VGEEPDRGLSPTERYLIEVVTGVARRDLGQDWGLWCERDARDESGLRVDVTFEDRSIALELTSLHDPEWRNASATARKMEARLTSFAQQSGLGGWVITARSDANLNDIEAPVKELMESGTEITPMGYSSHDLVHAEAQGERPDLLSRHHKLQELGLLRLVRRPGSEPVHLWVIGAGFEIGGFTDLLDDAVASNAAKLGESRPRETHLAVLVLRWDLSEAASETSVPVLPDEIDVVWVVHPGRSGSEAQVWLGRRGDDGCRLTTSFMPRHP
jgi:hypothetical protein